MGKSEEWISDGVWGGVTKGRDRRRRIVREKKGTNLFSEKSNLTKKKARGRWGLVERRNLESVKMRWDVNQGGGYPKRQYCKRAFQIHKKERPSGKGKRGVLAQSR